MRSVDGELVHFAYKTNGWNPKIAICGRDEDVTPLAVAGWDDEPDSGCINCGLPLVKNPHPNAGKMEMLMWIGPVYVCVACVEKRANGRRELLRKLVRWLQEREDVETLSKIAELEEEFRLKYHEADTPKQTNSPNALLTDEPSKEDLTKPLAAGDCGGCVWMMSTNFHLAF